MQNEFRRLESFEHYLASKEGYLLKFDLKNGYHHIYSFEPYGVPFVIKISNIRI